MRRRCISLINQFRMASSNPSGDPPKLIFAPAGEKSSARAEQYMKGSLDRSSLSSSPFTQFQTWFTAAQGKVFQPETVCLSTASLPSGIPSSRFVYLKELDGRGFVIYSNWATSGKAADLSSNPQASLAFWWHEMERQVRVEGTTERLSSRESQVYFNLRARGSKIGAWASEQSALLDAADGEREVLEQRVKAVEKRFENTADEDIPVPDFWGGLRVVPKVVEFWQGRESRLHDRFKYTLVDQAHKDGQEAEWRIERLSP